MQALCRLLCQVLAALLTPGAALEVVLRCPFADDDGNACRRRKIAEAKLTCCNEAGRCPSKGLWPKPLATETSDFSELPSRAPLSMTGILNAFMQFVSPLDQSSAAATAGGPPFTLFHTVRVKHWFGFEG